MLSTNAHLNLGEPSILLHRAENRIWSCRAGRSGEGGGGGGLGSVTSSLTAPCGISRSFKCANWGDVHGKMQTSYCAPACVLLTNVLQVVATKKYVPKETFSLLNLKHGMKPQELRHPAHGAFWHAARFQLGVHVPEATRPTVFGHGRWQTLRLIIAIIAILVVIVYK